MRLSRQARLFTTLAAAILFLASTYFFVFDETYYAYSNPSLLTTAGWLQPRETLPLFKTPITTEAPLSVHFTDSRNGWAVGTFGMILHTTNGGDSWQIQSAPSKQFLYSVHFTDSRNGWTVGSSGTILHTANGGESWQIQSSPSLQNLQAVHFTDPRNGWAVGDSGIILHTVNGGESWQIQSSASPQQLKSVHFSDPRNGWIVGPGTILHTVNGGDSWQIQSFPFSGFLNAVHFTNSRNGWAVGIRGTILHTANGGDSWQIQSSPNSQNLLSVHFTDLRQGWAVGDSGTILHTANGGDSWQIQSSPFLRFLHAVSFTDPRNGWAVGDSGAILHTANGGDSWQIQSYASPQDLLSIHFTDSRNGWAVGDFGTILHTINGGGSWQIQSSPSQRVLYSVHFTDSRQGWAVGDSGTILHTVNGGDSWQIQSSPSERSLSSVHFTDSLQGWAVGYSGTILHTANGGDTWQIQSSPSLQIYYSVHFTDRRNGWIVGDSGTILHTVNSGDSWQIQSSAPPYPLRAVHFTDSLQGWALGYHGTIIHTANSGDSWQTQSSPSQQFLRAVHFTDSRNGWAVVDSGTILHTVNGGDSWQIQSSPSPHSLSGVHFTDSRQGWAVGIRGTILHTTNAGNTWTQQKLNTRYPAPIYWPLSLLTLITLVFVLRPSIPRTLSTIDAIATSDAPITSPAQDLLGRSALAHRLFRFLSNPNTKPPFCLSIEAAWGHGKSSIMGMLRHLLVERGTASTVWFNAWHHRKEDSVLAFLLEAIKSQSIPKCHAKPLFYAKLIWLRARTTAGLLLLTLIAFAGYFYLNPLNLPEIQPYATWIAAILAAWASYRTFLQPFHIDPTKLLTDLKQSTRLADLRGKTDLRATFLKELTDVIKCLPGQRLVIFLDDLDRCPPDHIVEMLEAINFLSGSSSCIFVLGIDRHYVETAVGLHYEKIAAARTPNLSPEKARQQFAKAYLEKLINITVGLPLLEASHVETMLRPGLPAGKGFRELKSFVPWVCLTLALFFGMLGYQLSSVTPPAPPVQQQITPQSEAQSTTPQPKTPIQPETKIPEKKPQPTQPQPLITNPQQWSKWLILAATTLTFFAIAAWIFFSPTKAQTTDTEEFLTALCAKQNEIYTRAQASPREVRRILNNIRLIAAGLPVPPIPPPNYPKWAKALERFSNNHQPLAPQPFAPKPEEIPALMLEYPNIPDPALLAWYQTDCKNLGFANPDHLISPPPSQPPPQPTPAPPDFY